MARSRNIKPGFFTNADLLECSPLTRLLFIGLWCEADRRGILEDRPKTLKIKILPGDNCDVDAMLDELADHGFIVRYQINGLRCLFITGFSKHQNPHQNESPSQLPAPEQYQSTSIQSHEQHKSNPADSLLLIPDSLIPRTDSLLLIEDSATVNRVSEGVVGGLPNERGDKSPPPAPQSTTETSTDIDNDVRSEPTPSARAAPKPRAHRLPDDWQPAADLLAWAAEKTSLQPPALDAETEKFRDYYRGSGKTQVDWPATWRNWIRKAEEYHARASPGHSPAKLNGQYQPVRAVTAEYQRNMARLAEIARGES